MTLYRQNKRMRPLLLYLYQISIWTSVLTQLMFPFTEQPCTCLSLSLSLMHTQRHTFYILYKCQREQGLQPSYNLTQQKKPWVTRDRCALLITMNSFFISFPARLSSWDELSISQLFYIGKFNYIFKQTLVLLKFSSRKYGLYYDIKQTLLDYLHLMNNAIQSKRTYILLCCFMERQTHLKQIQKCGDYYDSTSKISFRRSMAL